MKYLGMLYIDQEKIFSLPRHEFDTIVEEAQSYFAKARNSGQLVTAQLLQPAQTATTVRKRNGKVIVTDGPFAETKEQLAGFTLIEAKDLNDAIQFASSLPGARYGTVEVRAVANGFKDFEPFLTGVAEQTGDKKKS